jgi:hypothetical protein
MKNILGVFNTAAEVNEAVASLELRGYGKDDISVVATKEALGSDEIVIEDNRLKGVTDTALTGGVIGGILGLLVGVGALTIPGLGLLFITGPVAAALGITGVAGATVSGALTGTLAGGIVGALMQLGVEEQVAKDYASAVESGKIILGVESADEDVDDVTTILTSSGATKITELDVKAR